MFALASVLYTHQHMFSLTIPLLDGSNGAKTQASVPSVTQIVNFMKKYSHHMSKQIEKF